MKLVSKFAWHIGQPMPAEMVNRFWAKVEKGDGCWLWTGRRFGETEYGSFSVCIMTWRGPAWRPEAAHRLAYELSVGPIPVGLHVLHSCDTRICCRPDHLRGGTDRDNKNDVILRKRMPRGSKHTNAKITERDVLRIRVLYAKGDITQKALAAQYGIDLGTMNPLLHGRTWKHVGGPVIPAGVRLQTKLTGQNVSEIRRLHRDGLSLGRIATKFGITKTHVWRLVHHHPSVWKNVP